MRLLASCLPQRADQHVPNCVHEGCLRLRVYLRPHPRRQGLLPLAFTRAPAVAAAAAHHTPSSWWWGPFGWFRRTTRAWRAAVDLLRYLWLGGVVVSGGELWLGRVERAGSVVVVVVLFCSLCSCLPASLSSSHLSARLITSFRAQIKRREVSQHSERLRRHDLDRVQTKRGSARRRPFLTHTPHSPTPKNTTA